jgi:hypothetical protein
MRKLLLVALLSLAGVGLGTQKASAWGLCSKCFHHCCCSTQICCRAYNAFSPSVFGTIYADGCCPISFGNGGPGGPGCGGPGCGGPGFCGGGPCGPDGGCGHAAMMPPGRGPAVMLPAGNGAPFQAPAPAPVSTGQPTGALMYPTGLQAAGYGPMMAPQYPAYWGNQNGR